MKLRGIAALLITVGLAACQTAAPAPQQAAVLESDIVRLKTERDAGRLSYTEWAERTGAAARANVALSADQEAAIAYRTKLAQQVDAGNMTPVQFERESARTLQRLKAARS
ncbi:hypothetical protein [Methylobacterium sp. Leaf108]|uniref:hypothetical protein n=1 Tax=Methylobacterium sp. Leaf108 TaxID=1736256 RepID=UPI0006F8E032|nr:hypothetical protein [Methylobacterium sp. Leaf108]KQP53693.1 hypothetical protein ASF39_19750 [Methylobacterium sp. Leaf108]